MMKTISIHQPAYFPWLGLVQKIAASDVFVVLDSVQYGRHAFQNRTLYSTRDGARYLTLPVRSKGHIEQQLTIRDIELADQRLPRKHFQTLQQRYGKTPGWLRVKEELGEVLLGRQYTHLLDLNLQTLALTLHVFGLQPQIVFASALGVNGSKSELVLEICKTVVGNDGGRYLSGQGAKAYMDESLFAEAGIPIVYQQFQHPVYRQSHGGDFQPGCLALEWYLEEPDAVYEVAGGFST